MVSEGTMAAHPVIELPGFRSIEALEQALSRPTPEVIDSIRGLDGDIMVLGAGGKMGPSLTTMAQRVASAEGMGRRVIAASRYSDPRIAEELRDAGVEVIASDLMDEQSLQALPDAQNIVYMVGTKFGSTGQEARTWAINAYLPGRVVDRFRQSRFVVFSSGNVYPFAPVSHGGSTEKTLPGPVGEYAQSVLGRERVFEYLSAQHNVPCVFFRLNYAVEMRYGVLLDIARKVWEGAPIDLSTGHVNCLWQGDANAYALRSLSLAESPPRILNVTGPETLSVRSLALEFGELLGRRPLFENVEQPDALLSNAQQAMKLFGYPSIPVGRVIEWVAAWVADGGPVLDKPTKFQVRDGRF
jgi:nucleoside-diphosphate-sugar epimerase